MLPILELAEFDKISIVILGNLYPFFKISKAIETKYFVFGSEFLVACLSIKHFMHLLEGRLFTLFTYHKPFTHALRKF